MTLASVEMLKTKRDISRLLPDRHPQPDFFVCDIVDAAPKSDSASMEYPLFSLSTKPDHGIREYRNKDTWLKVSPSPSGLATVHDRDILIYCISQCMAALNQGQSIEKTMRFKAADLLIVTNRKTSGEGYRLLRGALKRLQGTQIETNITTGGKEQWDVFSFIDSARTIKEGRDGRMQEIEITLSDWVFGAIQEKGGDILTISRDYFRLRKPLERRLYELARKCCGTKNKRWLMKLTTLHDRTGSQSSFREFKRMMKVILDDHDHIPDYTFELIGETVYIWPRKDFKKRFNGKKSKDASTLPHYIKPETYESAQRLSQGWDIYLIENEWRAMLKKRELEPDSPNGSFIGYVKWFVADRGPAPRGTNP